MKSLQAFGIRIGIVTCILLMDVTIAFARAGGGGGYSSGGSSSSSSSSSSYSSGGSGGELTGSLVLDVIILLISSGGMFHILRQSKIRMAAIKAVNQEEQERLARRLVDRDPRFDRIRFNERVESAFLRIQEAWSNQDFEDVRGFMSDGVLARFSIQIKEHQSLGFRNEMSNVQVIDVSLEEVRSFEHFDVVSVRIFASARDRRVAIDTGIAIEGTTRNDSFTEIWSFLRGRNQSSTESGEGLIEGRCPNCAAPVEPKQGWGCTSCGAALEGAPPDWVLTEITQFSEWSNAPREEPAWLKAAIDRDPGLTSEQLEDRASVLFWRLMDSDRTGKADRLKSVTRPAFLEQQATWLAGMQSIYTGDCSVGSVALRGVLPGQEWDRALVEIRWCGEGFDRRAFGGPKANGQRRLRRSLLVMTRKSSVRSDLGRCIISAHCAGCGAPDEVGNEDSCGFCGATLNDGHDWLIDRFLDVGESEAHSLLAEAAGRESQVASRLTASSAGGSAAGSTVRTNAEQVVESPPGGEEFFAWSLLVAYSDGKLTRGERRRLAALGKKLAIPGPKVRELVRAAQFGQLEAPEPSHAAAAKAWLAELKSIAGMDGDLAREERLIIGDLESRLGGVYD